MKRISDLERKYVLEVLDNEFNAIDWKRVNNTTDSYRCVISKKKLDKINSIINEIS